jgi:hypothetical protein
MIQILNTKNIVGFILCMIGTAILIYILPKFNPLILIPIGLFVISLFIKRPKWAILLNILILLPFIIFYFIIRFPTSNSIVFDSKIYFLKIDFGKGDLLRNFFEHQLNNRRVFLDDSINNINYVYVDIHDFNKLWSESLDEMESKKYTIKARFKTYRILTGDYSKASLIKVERVYEKPMILKNNDLSAKIKLKTKRI